MRTRSTSPPAAEPEALETAAPADAAIELRPAEVLWLGGTAVIAAVCWASLATAHLGVLSVGSVLGLAAAMLAALAVPVWLSLRRGRRRLAVGGRLGWVEVAALAAGAGLLLLLYLPGFPYGVADKDPGGYVQHGFWIARTGDFRIHDQALARLPDMTRYGAGVRFPGIWISNAARAEVVPQFYHLYPATLGFLGRLSGQTAMMSLNALLAVVSAAGVYLVGRRLAGPAAGAVAATVLALDMVQVWQAKYPTTEISTQLFFVLTILGLVVAAETRWWPPATLAGAALGVAWLDRPDTLLPVLIALGVLAAAAVLGRFGRLHAAFALGLAALAPHAPWQALGPAGRYSQAAGGITAGRLALAAAALAAGALVGRLLWRGPLGRWAEPVAGRLAADRRRRLGLKALLPAGLALLALVAWFRPQLFGPDYFDYNGRLIRSYDEQNLRRLAWFVTVPGIAATLAGFAVVALRRWRASVWIAVGPAVVLLVLYVYQAVNSTRLMWWSRRYVPSGLLVFALLIGIACAAAWAWRSRGRWLARLAAVAVAGVVVGTGLVQSLPLARHQEFGGSFAASARIAAAADGRQGVFVWGPRRTYYDTMPLFAAPVWLQRGQLSVILPPNGTRADLERIQRAFPGQPLFLVTGSLGLPPTLRQAGLRKVDGFRVVMPFWQESDTQRPSSNVGVAARVEIWSLNGR
jgi:Dolichyl-phosphate-mannose-protein mannosyltransferase